MNNYVRSQKSKLMVALENRDGCSCNQRGCNCNNGGCTNNNNGLNCVQGTFLRTIKRILLVHAIL